MGTLEFICKKFSIDLKSLSPRKMPHIINPFDRVQFASMLGELEFKSGVEVGVERGKYAQCLCSRIPGLVLYGVDPYIAYENYIDYTDQELIDEFYAEAKSRLKGFPNFIEIKEFSVNAAKQFTNESLDFVYIDGNHDLLNVIMDLNAWVPKIRKGGIVSGHDYVAQWKSQLGTIHVQNAVIAWTKTYYISPWFAFPGGSTSLTRHGSFFWVK